MEVRLPNGQNRVLKNHQVQIDDVVYSDRDLIISPNLRASLGIKEIMRIGYNNQIYKKIDEIESEADDIITITPILELKMDPDQAAEALYKIIQDAVWSMYKIAGDYQNRYEDIDSPFYDIDYSIPNGYNVFKLALKDGYNNIDSELCAVLDSGNTDEEKVIALQDYNWNGELPEQWPENG